RGIKKLAAGTRAIHPATSASAILKLIEQGFLPRRALGPIALDAGHARAMLPFASVRTRLLRLKLGSVPSPGLLDRITKLVALHRDSILDFRRVENEERARFREAGAGLRGALMMLREVTSGGSASEAADAYLAVATAAEAVQAALNALVVSRWQLRTPRLVAEVAVRNLLPPMDPTGIPSLGSLVVRLKEQLGDGAANFETAVEILRQLVRSRWNEDPFQIEAGNDVPDSSGGLDDVGFRNGRPGDVWRLPAANGFEEERAPPGPWDGDERLVAADKRLGSMYSRKGLVGRPLPIVQASAEDRFARAVLRDVPPLELAAFLVLKSVENWYFSDDFGETIESDFEDRLRSLHRWAARRAGPGSAMPVERVSHADGRRVRLCEAAAEPSWVDIKGLLRDLAKVEVRPWSEMNIDVPDPLPVDKQWWKMGAG
ncbi:MAG: hypothetical protein CFE26_16195, partial [Verrucomicrobiales bacterium VVV1]